MDGRLASGKAVVPLPRDRTVPLRQRIRGKASVADVTVLFQLVCWPRLARPRLPASLRGSVLGMVDRSFAALLALSFLAHLGFVLQLRRIDWPHTVEHLTDDFRQVFVHQPLPREIPTLAPVPSQATASAKNKPKRKVNVTKLKTPPLGERKAQLVDDINEVGLLAVLTAKRAEAGSAFADLLTNGALDRSQEAALAGVNTIALASADSRLGIRLGSGRGTVVDVRGLSSTGVGIAAADTGTRHELKVPHINSGKPAIDDSSAGHLDPGQLAREVRGRMGALRACYERSLKRNPTLAGKLVLQLSITPAGTVSAVALTSDSLDDPDLASCVRRSVLRWRFPAPEGGGIDVSFPFVFQSAG